MLAREAASVLEFFSTSLSAGPSVRKENASGEGYNGTLTTMLDIIGRQTLLGRRMATFNRLILNHLTRPLARHLPGFGVIIHRGRISSAIWFVLGAARSVSTGANICSSRWLR